MAGGYTRDSCNSEESYDSGKSLGPVRESRSIYIPNRGDKWDVWCWLEITTENFSPSVECSANQFQNTHVRASPCTNLPSDLGQLETRAVGKVG